jgi:23S rRNA (cytosine1962-C5)-methyltransferase
MGNKLTSHLWQEYALIDSGNQFKLERFGNTYLKRPEPQAVWQPKLSDSKWTELASASFQRKKTNEEDGYEDKCIRHLQHQQGKFERCHR